MSDCLYLAWRYVVYYRVRTLSLIAALTLLLFVPFAVESLVRKASVELRSRASTTPLIVGAHGSETELVLNTLYFTHDAAKVTPFSTSQTIDDTQLATPIPLYVRFQARGFPIVGTTADYFDFRAIRLAHGNVKMELGECIVGAAVAQELQLNIDDAIVSTPESAFDLAGVYPLKMRVAGILRATGTPDDRAIFTSLKTTWIIAGLGHGHDDIVDDGMTDEQSKAAHAAAMTYREVTRANRRSFHFHGDDSTFPITAVIAVPHDDKSQAILLGKFQADETLLITKPTDVIESLLETIFRVRSFVIAGATLLACSTLLLVGLVLSMSLRMRQAEIATMTRLGASRMRVIGIVACENAMVLCAAVVVASSLVLLLQGCSDWIMRLLL